MKIETHDLVKTYGERTVVNHVNVTVEQGKIVGLLGPNGAGKTTTFYMMSVLSDPMKDRLRWMEPKLPICRFI